MNDLLPNTEIVPLDEKDPLFWYCYKLKVTESLTLMIGVNIRTQQIRIRGTKGQIHTIDGKLEQCWNDTPTREGEVFANR